MVNTEFLGIQIGNDLNWKNHIEQMIPELSGATMPSLPHMHSPHVHGPFYLYILTLQGVTLSD